MNSTVKKYKFVFVVLVYKNLEVLDAFFRSLNINDSRVIIVESFSDEETAHKCKTIAFQHSADYISIENKGYGYGNNEGVKYALNHYRFDYLVISNSDIIIEDIDKLDSVVKDLKSFVIAPLVKRVRDNKRQNPNIVRYSSIYYGLLRYAYNKDSEFAKTLAHIISRVQREVFIIKEKMTKKPTYKIFSPHGSFIIFSYDAILKLNPLFNERMFLYNEELFLGLHCKNENIPVYFTPLIKIKHFEGASTSDKEKEFKRYQQSFLELDKWRQLNSNCNGIKDKT